MEDKCRHSCEVIWPLNDVYGGGDCLTNKNIYFVLSWYTVYKSNSDIYIHKRIHNNIVYTSIHRDIKIIKHINSHYINHASIIDIRVMFLICLTTFHCSQHCYYNILYERTYVMLKLIIKIIHIT